jgi:hypothetical protein
MSSNSIKNFTLDSAENFVINIDSFYKPNNTNQDLINIEVYSPNTIYTNDTSTAKTFTIDDFNLQKINSTVNIEYPYYSIVDNYTYFINNKSFYNISNCLDGSLDTSPTDILSIEYNKNMNYDINTFSQITNSLSLDIFNKDRLNNNLRFKCPGSNIRYYLRINEENNFNDLYNYHLEIKQNYSINILDKDEEFFTSRCYRYPTNSTFPFLTLKQRKNSYFFNYTSKCVTYNNKTNENSLCKIADMNSTHIICDCGTFTEVISGIFEDHIPDVTSYNINLISCISSVSKNVK